MPPHPIILRPLQLVVLACLFWYGWPLEVLAQGVTPTKGKDFWFGFMKNYETDPAESLDVFIVSDVATSGTIEVPGQGWSQVFAVSPNVTTTVTIPNSVAEVYSSGVVESKGVHIATEDTVAVFAISFNPFTADGTKILPTPTLGTNYMVASYAGLSPWDSELLVVSTSDGTEVKITPSVTTAAGQPAGIPFTVQLSEGECYQLRSAAGLDLTGTRIEGTEASGSCRPFAVFSGAGCTNIPQSCVACDHIYEQNFPLELWGTEYYITPFVFELDPGYPVAEPNYTYRVLASSPGTVVSIDGGPGAAVNAGQFLEFQFTPDPHCITANFPIAVIQYMQGISCGGNGDPAMLILDDVTKKIDNITFSTVESTVISSHYLNVVINAADLGSVTLDGVPIAPSLFQDFPACPGQMWCGFEISEGSHTLDATGGGVTGYVYGNGPAESYAYSVGSFSPLPPIVIDEAFCTNDQVQLQVPGNYNSPYWYNYAVPGDTLFEGYTFIVTTPITNGIYVGVGNESVSGCEEEFHFSVEVPTPPDISLLSDVYSLCQYESAQLGVSAFPENAVYSYSWSPATGLDNPASSHPLATPLETTLYTVTVSTPTGCGVVTADVLVEVSNGTITRFDASPEDAFICAGESVQLSVEAEIEVWSDNFDPGISWGDWASIQNGSESSICGTVSGNALYFNGTGDRSATTDPMDCSGGGTIYFSLKIANGVAPCDNAEPGDDVVLEYSLNGVTFIPIQTFFESAYPQFVSLAIPIPAGAQSPATRFRWRQTGAYVNNQDNWVLDNAYIGVNQPAALAYAWTPATGLDNASSANPVATPAASATYLVTTTDPQSGCAYSDSIQVTVGQPFALDVSADTVLCDIQGIVLHAIPESGDPLTYTYQWSPSSGLSGANTPYPTATPAATTTYEVLVTSEEGCSAQESVTVTVSQLLDLAVSSSALTICAGQEVQLEAQVGGDLADLNWHWSPGALVEDSLALITASSPAEPATYTATLVHEPSGCSISESVTIDVVQAFEVQISPDTLATCVLTGAVLSASHTSADPVTWSWAPSSLVSGADQAAAVYTGSGSAEITASATSPAGCTASDTVYLIQVTETTDLGGDTGFCEDADVVLDAGWPETYTIEWSTGDFGPALTVTETGTYSVVVTSPEGCVSGDTVTVTMFTYPEVDLGPDRVACADEDVELVAGPPGLNYSWSTGAQTPVILVMESGSYSVEVNNGYCFAGDAINVAINPLPADELPERIPFCFGFPPYQVELNAGNPGMIYLWSGGSTDPIIYAGEPGYYSVTITTPFGCDREEGVLVVEECSGGSLYIPNSFSPNGDGINEAWLIKGENIGFFQLDIWNRWGEWIYTSQDLDRPWLGQRRDGDTYVESDAYIYRVKYRVRETDGELSDEMEYTGHVNVIR